jgi:hypothetical protein
VTMRGEGRAPRRNVTLTQTVTAQRRAGMGCRS